MREFWIHLGSVREVQEFVDIAATRCFPVVVRDNRNKISADSFMELFCLDFSQPVRVDVECSDQEYDQFLWDLRKFVVE